MTAHDLVRLVLEAEDEGELDIKDLLGGAEHLVQAPMRQGTVSRHPGAHIRWSRVQFGKDLDFCVSYLTPVAYYAPGDGTFITDKFWSKATYRHIIAWLNEVTSYEISAWKDVIALTQRYEGYRFASQAEITAKFKEALTDTEFPRRDIERMERVPSAVPFLKGGTKDRVNAMHVQRQK